MVLSKRKLIQLVDDKHVAGWDDPRLPTLVGARRRGFTAEGFKRFAERIGVSKADSWIDMSVLEDCMREDLNESAERRVANPIKFSATPVQYTRAPCALGRHTQEVLEQMLGLDAQGIEALQSRGVISAAAQPARQEGA